MRKLFLLFLPLFAASCGQVKQQAPAPEPVNVMSFNIRYDNPEDSLDNWQYRKDRAQMPSVFMMWIYWVRKKYFIISWKTLNNDCRNTESSV